MDERKYLARHLRNMRRNSRRVRALLEKSYAKLGREIASQKFVSPTTFAWSKNVKLAKRVDLILGQQNFRLKNEITRSIISEWKLASEKNDELVRKYLGDTYVYQKARKELFQANTEALNAFLLRTDTNQFNLSKRVWNLTKDTKAQLKYHIGQGIATGKPAAEISRDIRNVLVEPNRLYRRVRDKTDKLVLSKPAKLYKPGSGVYRSSYKNALRLAITETNMAYRTSDFVRRNQLPFIVGYKVNLSGSHPMTDICDDMKGVYPKEFRFVGWHPHCYDKETEVYTSNGWRYFWDLDGEEKILSLNRKNKNIEFVGINEIVEYHYKGKMVSYKNRSLDMLVTPEHKMIYFSKGRKEKFNEKQAVDYKSHHGPLYRSCNWIGRKITEIEIGKKKFDFNVFAGFLGYYLSEGSTSRKYAVTVSQSKKENRENYDKIYNCLLKLNIKIHKGEMGFNMYDKDLWLYLKKFGKSFEKYVPEIIKESGKKQIRIFLDAFLLGDGTVKRSKEFVGNRGGKGISKPEKTHTTSSKSMADDLGELILKSGKRPSFFVAKTKGKEVKFKNGTYKINNNQYTIRECRSVTASVFYKKEVEYDDFVYDIELEKNNVLYIRRNGKCVWGSNCICYTTSINMKKDEFIKYLKTGKINQRLYVNKLPIKAERYVNKHANKIVKMKNKPYWTENFTQKIKLKSSIGQTRSLKELELK